MRKGKRVLALAALSGVLLMSAAPVTSQAGVMPMHDHDYFVIASYDKGTEWRDNNTHVNYAHEYYKCRGCSAEYNEVVAYYEEHSYDWDGSRFVCECGDFYQ